MLKVAFYKAQKGHWLDFFIDKLSGGLGYSHVELVFSDGMCFSSSSRDASAGKKNGTRFKRITNLDDLEKWELVDVPECNEADEGLIRQWCEQQLDSAYDFRGVFRFILPFIPEHPTKYFCSEVVVDALRTRLLLPKQPPSHKIAPNQFRKMVLAEWNQ